MDKTYKPSDIEQHWIQQWEKEKLAQTQTKGQPYCIMLPPPNVTGTLHMGHGFQQTLMDALIRYHRMQKHATLWQGGTDHAGIATQMVVERQLKTKGKGRLELGRDAFVDEVWKWKEISGNCISEQMKRLGTSMDWNRARFTMDEMISRATYEAFIRLYNDGLIYRGQKLVNWDPALHTAISDLEVETEEVDGHLWHIRYPLINHDSYLIVATTRPETLLGDTAVAVHPEDERYKKLIGKQIRLPLTDRIIPIIADKSVEPTFGTGCVKITPAHDFNDYEIGKRHDLPMINILTPDAKINENAPKRYQGLDRYVAREHIVKDLQAQGLLEKTEPHRLNVPKGDRSGVTVEPYLTHQWFVKMKSLAEPALNAVNNGDVKFIPENWSKTYCQWLEGIQDWCISRQLWWGHRIPVWYDDCGHSYVGFNELDARERHHIASDIKLTQDTDVLDTWFSASLWPFATLGWPEKTTDLKTFYPTHVLITGFDIIFFWVARMVMMSLKLTGKIPFKEVYITGLIRDSHGKKMSKTKGNVLDPIDIIDGIDLKTLIEKRTSGLMQPQLANAIEKMTAQEFPEGIAEHGTDALRFTFCALATNGRDINFDLGRVEGYRHFCNKLWNAARYAMMNTQGHDMNDHKALQFSTADRWIRSHLQNIIEQTHQYFEQYRFDLLAQMLYEFTWNEYCDWYLEFAKCDLTRHETGAATLRGTRLTILEVLEKLLRLLHPLMPFITEEIWQKVAPLVDQSGVSIMVASFPQFQSDQIDKTANKSIAWLKKIIIAIRTIRAEMNINPGKRIPVIFNKGSKKEHEQIASFDYYIKTLAKVSDIGWAKPDENLQATATCLIGTLEIHIPLTDLIDKNAELSRLNKEIEKLEKEFEKSSQKLNNANYINKAPEEIVSKEKKRLEQTKLTLKKLREQYINIEKL
ncbi:MAG: valine--tRNA ligase [Coxiella sp. RIFCSPHIGHO2_12_FULL_42_15]|nr:MAG: valine--tRNA ligase [Coxiella sp. RIFCSPHIGHO2_12_FULL_42_15]